MSNNLVRLITDEDGDTAPDVWHLSWADAGSNSVFCTGEFYNVGGAMGEGNAHGEEKTVARGGITCRDCYEQILQIKGVRL